MQYQKLTHSGHLVSSGAIDALASQANNWAFGIRLQADGVIAALNAASRGLGLAVFTDGPGGTEIGHIYLFRAANNTLRIRLVTDVTTEADSGATIAAQLQAGDYLIAFVHPFNDGAHHRDLALYRDRGGVLTLLASTSGSGDGGFQAGSADLRMLVGASGSLGGTTMVSWTGLIDGFYLLDTAVAVSAGERQTFLWDDADVVLALDMVNQTGGVFEDLTGNGETFAAQGVQDTNWAVVAGGDWNEATPAGGGSAPPAGWWAQAWAWGSDRAPPTRPPLRWTDEQVEQLARVTPRDVEVARAWWQSLAPRRFRDLLDATAEEPAP